MNELLITINFTTQKFIINGIDLISGDYNSTKIKFNFEDNKEGTKVVEIRPLDSEDKNPTFMSTIINDEVILVSKTEEDVNTSPFTKGGTYIMEVSLYNEDSKLSTITKHFNVLDEQIILSDEIIEPYLPIFDELMQQIITATTEASNINIESVDINNGVRITITDRNGVIKSTDITNGVDGVGIKNIMKIATAGLNDTYRITLTNDTYYDYIVKNGKGIVSITKIDTTGYVDTYKILYNDGTYTTFTVTNGNLTKPELYQEMTYITNILPKVNGTGSSITLSNTGDSRLLNLEIDGKTVQDGTPTPTNEIKIENVGYQNLFDNNAVISESSAILEITDTGFNVTRTHNSGYGDEFIASYTIDNLKKNTTYTLSANITSTATIPSYFVYAYSDILFGTALTRVSYTPVGNFYKWNFTTNDAGKMIIGFYAVSSSQNIPYNISNIQLEEGNKEYSYIPYSKYGVEIIVTDTDNIKHPYLYTLDEPIRSLGEKHDKLYIENSILYLERNIGSRILNGSETWDTIGNNRYWIAFPNKRGLTSAVPCLLKSNYFNATENAGDTVNIGQMTEGYYTIANYNVFFNYNGSNSDLAGFKTWLSTHNTEVLYVLATPTTENLGEINLPLTYYNETLITTSDLLEPTIKVTALKDISNL